MSNDWADGDSKGIIKSSPMLLNFICKWASTVLSNPRDLKLECSPVPCFVYTGCFSFSPCTSHPKWSSVQQWCKDSQGTNFHTEPTYLKYLVQRKLEQWKGRKGGRALLNGPITTWKGCAPCRLQRMRSAQRSGRRCSGSPGRLLRLQGPPCPLPCPLRRLRCVWEITPPITPSVFIFTHIIFYVLLLILLFSIYF